MKLFISKGHITFASSSLFWCGIYFTFISKTIHVFPCQFKCILKKSLNIVFPFEVFDCIERKFTHSFLWGEQSSWQEFILFLSIYALRKIVWEMLSLSGNLLYHCCTLKKTVSSCQTMEHIPGKYFGNYKIYLPKRSINIWTNIPYIESTQLLRNFVIGFSR